MKRPSPLTAADFAHFAGITTRWIDNDVYGHVNNVVYYEFFDTVVNGYLIAQGALDIAKGAVIGLVVETHCNYFKPVAFPDKLRAGLRVAKLGTSSVRYEVGIFRNDDDTAAAQGHFVHVYVDRATNKPVPLPEALKQALEKLVR
ncbi:MAG TPA: thioesterase family protein [Xanthobacteraceae bacterium]|nr:thioesterase family protein [Xanthobacteraceae bacterium]